MKEDEVSILEEITFDDDDLDEDEAYGYEEEF